MGKARKFQQHYPQLSTVISTGAGRVNIKSVPQVSVTCYTDGTKSLKSSSFKVLQLCLFSQNGPMYREE